MGNKKKITIKLSRYQKDKLLGERWRNEADAGEPFSVWRKKNRKR